MKLLSIVRTNISQKAAKNFIKSTSFFLFLLIILLNISSCSNANTHSSTNPSETASIIEMYSEIETTTDNAIRYTTTALNVRNGPGTEYSILETLQPGSKVCVLSEEGDWSKIEYHTETAYVATKYLTDDNSQFVEQEPETTTQKPVQMVWIPYSGSKYHRRSSCSNMKGPTQVSIEEAKRRGYSPCKKCY